jgi:ppGpp synthetase/RelA/SpoT-type nucleotidyltranferase
MSDRTVEDRLREEYSSSLPDLLRVCEHLKAQIHYLLLPVISRLSSFESIVVKSRVKEGKSAIDALRRRGIGGAFDRDTPERYSLLSLRDLVGVRVLAFPSNRVIEVDQILRSHFSSWTADSVLDKETGKPLAFKYYGLCLEASSTVVCEYQVASMLTGLFWEVEHAAIYKPAPNLKGLTDSPVMQKRTSEVYRALEAFEEEFEMQVRRSENDSSTE